jgi:hypothetical protein
MSASEIRSSRSRAEIRQEWAERLQRFAHSGLSVVAFCRVENIPVPSFYYWKRKLQAPSADTTRPTPQLLPIRLLAASPLEVVLPSGTLLRLTPGCDLDLFRSVLSALEGRPC